MQNIHKNNIFPSEHQQKIVLGIGANSSVEFRSATERSMKC